MRSLLLVVGLTSIGLLATAVPALAASGSSASSGAASAGTVVGPYSITQPDGTEPAGEVCSFGLGFTYPTQDLQETDYYDAAGTLVKSFVTGPLITKVTNLTTGQSVVRSESGPGWFYYHPDGSLTIVAPEHIGIGFHTGDTPADEFLITTGLTVLDVSATGTKTLVKQDGTAENLCDTLAG
jgi:hypothetical protein